MAVRTETQTFALEAWVRLLRGHAATVRALNAQLLRDHHLTINDYEALLVLAHADGERLRRADLVENLQLTASGVTRLLEGLEAAGLVGREQCAADGRVTYAVLTDAGRAKLEESSCSHLAAIEELFGERFSPGEMETLADLLGRLPGAAEGKECTPPARSSDDRGAQGHMR
jgi:DNA-binding MarR family transcriptional regulator